MAWLRLNISGFGGSELGVSALIKYLMDTISTETDGTRYLDNHGSSGAANDAAASACQGLWFDGTQSIDFTYSSATYAVYYSHTANAMVQFELTGSPWTYQPAAGVYSSMALLTGSLSAGGLTYLNENQEVLTKIALGGTDSGIPGLTQSDFEYFFPLSDNLSDEYVQDIITAKSSDLLQGTTEQEAGNATMVLGAGGYTTTSDGTGSTLFPRLRFDNLTNGKVYTIEVDETVNSGACTDCRLYDGNSYISTGRTAGGKSIFIFTCYDNSNAWFSYDGTQTFNISAVGTLKEVHAEAILSPHANRWTDADHLNKGPQKIAFVLDELNRPTAMADANTLRMYPGEDITTGWTPSAPYSVCELVDGVDRVLTYDGITAIQYIDTVPSAGTPLAETPLIINDSFIVGSGTVSARGEINIYNYVLAPGGI